MKNTKAELERTILGIIITNNDLIAAAITMLRPEYFTCSTMEGKSLRYVYELLVAELTNSDISTQKAVDAFYLSTYHGFTDSDALSLLNSGASAKNFESYCGALKKAYEKQKRQSLASVLDSIEKSNISNQEKDNAYHEAFQEAMDRTDFNDNPILHIKDAFRDTIEEMQAQLEKGDTLSGISTGFDCLDSRHGGLEAGRVYYIAGRSKMGKTTLALNIGENVALNGGHVVNFSLEMPRSELVKKIASSIGQIDYHKMRMPKLLNDNDWACMSHAMNIINETKLHIKDSVKESRESIRAELQKHQLKHGHIDLVIIDYPDLMEGHSTKEEIAETGRWLKLIAGEFNCSVIPLYQINKSIDNRENKRPNSSDLAYISEAHADAVIMVYRDAWYNENSPFQNGAEIITGVARNAQAGTDFLEFKGQYQKFVNLDESEINRLRNLKNAPVEEKAKKFKNRFE
jgi:replicative DNA helicase